MTPVFILGAHKSGTSMLRQLFDGHSQVEVFPIESHFIAAMGLPISYAARKQEGFESKMESFFRFVNELVLSYNSEKSTTTDVNLFDKIDTNLFKEEIKKRLRACTSENQWLEAYFAAIQASLNNKTTNRVKYLIEKSVEHAEYAEYLKLLFPEAKFIHIIRNPYSNIVSFRKFKIANALFPSLPDIVLSMLNNYSYLKRNQRIFSTSDYLIVKYEDILTDKKKALNEICLFLSIGYENSLEYPSLFGSPWTGNSTTGEKSVSIDASRLNNWKKEILPLEIEYCNRFFSSTIKTFSYAKTDTSKLRLFLPIKKESFKKYVRNRSFLLYANILDE